MLLLQDGMEALKGKTQVEIRHFRRKSKRFRLAEGKVPTLLYVERDGSMAICLVNEEIGPALQAAHDMHRHFAHAITLDQLVSNSY